MPRLSLPTQILIGMITGLVLGLAARALWGGSDGLTAFVQHGALPAGQVFLRMIFMVVVPLVFAALALGVAEIGDIGKFKRIGLKLLGWTMVFTTSAVVTGLTFVNVFQPGVGLPEAGRTALLETFKSPEATAKVVTQAQQAKSLDAALLELIPKNPLAEAVAAFDGGLVPLMTFALFVGLGMLTVGEARAAPLKAVLGSIYEIMLAIIGYAMKLAPFGVAALVFAVTATLGADVLALLAKYALVVLGALTFQLVVVYGAVVALVARRSPIGFLRDTREALLTAFSTSSSAATLPTAMRVARENLKLPGGVSDFTLTVGSSLNHHGTALYEGTTVLFLAQFFGIGLTPGQQLGVLGLAILGGIGTAGVPGGSLPMIVVIAHGVGVPAEGIGVILGVDRILDMARTTLNVSGDLAIATVIAATEPAEAAEAAITTAESTPLSA